jgi:2-oxoglutarate/2-oxoacid ferredoxin oxidoreductase subunit beta
MVLSAKPIPSTWCPGCGDFGVLAAVKKAVAELKIPAHETVLVGGIGCSGGIHNFLEINGLHALHGRLLAQAVGVKLANPKLTVIAAGGDGDGYAIGMGHFMHAFKKNASFLYILMMNETYGLTKGQAAPTAPLGYEGNIERPFDGVLTALSQEVPNFVARTFSGDPRSMTKILAEALQFNRDGRGFAFVEDLSPCVTYNDTYKEWREKVLDVSTLPGYDPADRKKIF